VLLDALPSGPAQSPALLRVAQQLQHAFRQGGRVARGYEQAGFAFDHDLGAAADAGGHHGKAAGHCLQQSERYSL
jgi:hypothetical protein